MDIIILVKNAFPTLVSSDQGACLMFVLYPRDVSRGLKLQVEFSLTWHHSPQSKNSSENLTEKLLETHSSKSRLATLLKKTSWQLLSLSFATFAKIANRIHANILKSIVKLCLYYRTQNSLTKTYSTIQSNI